MTDRTTLSRRWLLKGAAATGLAGSALSLAACGSAGKGAATTLLNVSYDPTREFYVAYNKLFATTAERPVTVNQSHGGSGKQTTAVIEGLEADVVSLALAHDIDAIAEKGLIAADWAKRLPYNSTPYYSTIVFLVRKGNPKAIKDWSDLVKPGIGVITPNPKTSGGARWNYLAAYGWALKANAGDVAKAEAYIEQLYRNVPVLDTGARGSTTTFVQRGQGDVLLAWENEALLALKDSAAEGFEVVYPSWSIRAEPPVAVVDKNVEKKGTKALATAYLEGLFSDEAQKLVAEYHYRPANPEIGKGFTDKFPELPLLSVDTDFGGWKKAHADFFAAGAAFDKLQARINK
ncbi:sulfate ABC transporter substrate-binding protein [Asticcacaulis sp. BYS171W]|uniref:Sulfate ABC transporter substrate-binding protein n=1 Tax=Asticcacaulis aquaticus TaxID=2984212 RepID=A0ABT5HR38_9CAUL|nr:sulfate ABC transporter substrate-binding protein [Asticcacaulis aquaticus]MDC7682514.1 sulfate ABC transporter substrate-binding protein [Asticcacaulis aquaticus]